MAAWHNVCVSNREAEGKIVLAPGGGLILRKLRAAARGK